MSRRCWAILALFGPFLALSSLAHFPSPAAAQMGDGKKKDKKDRGDALFGMTKLHAFHLEMSAEEWKKMQPRQGFGKGGFPGFKPKALPMPPMGKEPDVHKSAGAFGTEFPWVRATFTAGDQTFKDVGVRFKGNFTYVSSAQMLRRPMKIELDHYGGKAELHGEDEINLANGITDPARVRESLSFAAYRAAGLPASRTAYAELTLTVPGLYDRELVGLYTVVEQVDKSFLKRHFKDAKGLLLKPENLRGGLEYMGEDWSRYVERYRPKNEGTKDQKDRLIAFTRLVEKADDAQFRKEVAAYLDVDAFLRFMAVDTLLANLDSLLGYGHNFYLYLRPDTNQFVFMPWDLDYSMATWPAGGPVDRQVDLSIDHPHMGQNKLIDRLLAIKEVKEKYRGILRELTSTSFTKERLLGELESIEAVIRDPLAREQKATAARKEGKSAFGAMFGGTLTARAFIDRRTASVLAQLDGKRKGYVPAGFGFGPGGGFGPPKGSPKGPPGGFGPGAFGPGAFGPGAFLARPLFSALDTSKDGKLSREEVLAGVKQLFKECDADGKGMIDETQIAAGINKVVPRPAGFPAPAKGFGMGNLMSAEILKRADGNKDGKLNLEEFTGAALALFKEADKDNRGGLDETGVATAINLLMARPELGPPP